MTSQMSKMKSAKLLAACLMLIVAYFALEAESQQQQQAQTPSRLMRPRLRKAENERPKNERPTSTSTSTTTTTTTTTTSTTSTTTTTARPRAIQQGSALQTRSAGNGSRAERPPSGRFDFAEDELPPDFYELPPEQLDLGMNATGRAPTPILNVAVLQNGLPIDNAVDVHPGTPLEMVIYLDEKSSQVYGLLVSYLKVQDETFRQREEVIILNGCSIDSYIFGNFEHNPEDKSIRAKFRAFKFPESNFVRFAGTVNVCIKQCPKVNCGASANGAGRRKRSPEDDRLVSLTVSTVLRISDPVPARHHSN